MTRYWLIRPLLTLFGALPLCIHRAGGRFIGWIMHYPAGYRRKIIRKNLTDAFPGTDIRPVENAYYKHLGRLVTEDLWLGAAGPERFRKSGILRHLNPEVFRDVWESTDKGAVLLCSHLGNWELLCGILNSGEMGVSQDRIVSAYRSIKDPVWERIFNENRRKPLEPGYEGLCEAHDIVRRVISRRDERQCLLMITDQHPYKGTHCPMEVQFFGRTVHTMDGGATIACKLGWPVFYVSMDTTPKGYDIRFTHIDKTEPDAVMKEYYRLLEEDIRSNPSTYLWSHNRWKP